jgi:hypothetical protein
VDQSQIMAALNRVEWASRLSSVNGIAVMS